MISPDKSLIKKTLSAFKLKKIITSLKHKENTIINEFTDKNLLFLLDITRCYLSGAKVICIENIIQNLTEEYKNIFLHILKQLNKNCSIIIFSLSNNFPISVDKKYLIFKNSLKEIKK